MVFGLLSKESSPSRKTGVPPPPYSETETGNGPVLVAETTTTREIVTTTTTTQLFSRPLLRKRLVSTGSPAADMPSPNANRPMTMHSMFEKDLPPTPTETPPSPLLPSQSSAFALAHASLGLGLPHVLPQVAPNTEVNTVAFAKSDPEGPSAPSTSTHEKARAASTPLISEPPPSQAYGRARLNSSSAKGKAKEQQESNISPKTVVRKPSFWSRKKTASAKSRPGTEPATPDESNSLPLPELPSLQPISPFEVDLGAESPSPPTSSLHQRGLSRSFSERTRASREPSSRDESTAVPRRKLQRPKTAESHRKPEVVLSGFNASPPPTPSRISSDNHKLSRPVEGQAVPRPRSMTNPPILQRLSMTLFSGSPSLPFSSSPITATPDVSVFNTHANNSPRSSFNRIRYEPPSPPSENESPELYLQRLIQTVSKAEVAGLLASSADAFHVAALRAYMKQFDFVDDPLDIALRKLLMDVSLPRETQQIDRVIENFASRYSECNRDLFSADDQTYILAFSLIMLHTDAFNKSNKHKMTKADYIKNTRLPGVAPEVLDCFYDNIVFAPFIFIEDPLDVNGQRGIPQEGFATSNHSGVSNPLANPASGNPSLLGKSPKIDPYYLISHNLLEPLRVNVETIIPSANPYSYQGSGGDWDEQELQRAFTRAPIVEVGQDTSNMTVSYSASILGGPSPLTSSMPVSLDSPTRSGEIHSLRVTKVGLLNRKDDLVEGGKRAPGRKWKPWGAILTGSQLLLFRDLSWTSAILAEWGQSEGQVVLSHGTVSKPDELLSVKDAIAVFDSTYTRYANTMRLVLPDGRHILLQAQNGTDLNEWISRLNYASAFKSAGVRMRPTAMSGKDVQLTGVAAASSHLNDIQHSGHVDSKVHRWGVDAPHHLMGMLSGEDILQGRSHVRRSRATMISGSSQVDFDAPSAPEIEGADQFKATFDQVKADLASGRWGSSEDDSSSGHSVTSSVESSPVSPSSLRSSASRMLSRAQIVQSKIGSLKAKISAARMQLDTDMRFVKNVAILCPFQKGTRDRLLVALQGMAKRIMLQRLEITKLMCHREVLSKDLLAEEKDWRHAKRLALRSATELLSVEAGRRLRRRNTTTDIVPRDETLSSPNSPIKSVASLPGPSSSQLEAPSSSRVGSSLRESFYSAADYSSADYGELDDAPRSSFLSAPMFDSPRPTNSSTSSFPFHDAGASNFVPSSPGRSPRQSSESGAHEKFYTAHETPEELESIAEDWNKTRAAQRVSLVKLPSVLGLASHYEGLKSPNSLH